MMDLLQGRYEIQKTLGDRYGKKTYLARDRQTQTFVVVKLLLFNCELKWETVKLFEREANTLKALNHPAIPRYLDYFDIETETAKGFALVQSFIPADSLSQQVKAGTRFSEARLRDIARHVLGVLSYLHNRQPQIIHRDIKPSNILLSDQPQRSALDSLARPIDLSGHIFLVDFGAVQAMQSEGGTRTVVGTYGYMSPEQFGYRAVPASDLYGLGMTLIHLASGQQPADLPQQNLRVQFEERVSLSAPFVQWLRTMTAPAREERFSTVQKALQALDVVSFPDSFSDSLSDLLSDSLSTASSQCSDLSEGVRSESVRFERFESVRSHIQSKARFGTLIIKPLGSKVSLKKSPERIEIVIPPKGSTLALISILLIAIPVLWNTLLFIWSHAALSMVAFGLVSVLLTLGFLWAGIWMIYQIFYELIGYTVLTIDPQTIALKDRIFGVSFYTFKSAARKDINRLEGAKPTGSWSIQGRSYSPATPLNIWAGNTKFTLPSHRLAMAELDWIADELSDWLGLPIV